MHTIPLIRIFIWLAIGLLTTRSSLAQESTPVPADTVDLKPAPMDLCQAADDGFLSGELFGTLSGRFEWHGTDMDCGGMLRPDNEGIRLVFAAPLQEERLLIVLGIDANPDELTDGEHSVNVTIIDETQNRFFSTGRKERCWSMIESIRPVTDSDEQILQVVGEIYCSGSLPSISDNSSVSLRNMHYSGRLALDEADQD